MRSQSIVERFHAGQNIRQAVLARHAEQGVLAGAAKIGVDDEHLQAGGGKSESQVIDKIGLSFSGQGAGDGQDLELAPHAG
jgi:hypothetical protein